MDATSCRNSLARATRLTSSNPVVGTAGLIFRGSGAKPGMTATSYCSAAICVYSAGLLVNGETRQPKAGDVDFFDRTSRVAQEIERRVRDQLETGGTQLFEEIAQHDTFLRGQ